MQKITAINKIKEFCPLENSDIQALEQFVDALLEHNKTHNLIGQSTINDVWDRHILDSAQLIKYIDNKNLIIGDFGSGAGFPGVVLSILGVKEIHLMEKSFRKCQFLEIAKKFSDNKIVIHQKNIEEVSDIKFDLIISRAFAPLDRLISFIKPFAKKETVGIFLKGKNLANELEAAKKIHQFNYQTHPSITSNESSVIVISSFNNF